MTTITLVRWDSSPRKASELLPQECSWGGFKSSLLSFVPLNSSWVDYWEKECSKHHGVPMVPSFYSLELGVSYEDFIRECLLDYSEGSDFLKELGIHVTLAKDKDVVELRISKLSTLELLKDE